MLIDFKVLSMMELRSRPGEVLDDVARSGQTFVIERNGQQKACLVPISFFLPDIETGRVAAELEKLSDANERYRIKITEESEIQIVLRDLSDEMEIDVTVTLPHGYPNKAPIISAGPIREKCPHRWPDGTLCIYGAMDTWNPGKHDILHVLALCRRWIANYLKWVHSGEWPKDAGQ